LIGFSLFSKATPQKRQNQGKKMSSTPPHVGFSALRSLFMHCEMLLPLSPLGHWEKNTCRVNEGGGGCLKLQVVCNKTIVLGRFAECKSAFENVSLQVKVRDIVEPCDGEVEIFVLWNYTGTVLASAAPPLTEILLVLGYLNL
jgi:hypothetical protein